MYGEDGEFGGQLDTSKYRIIDNITGSLGHAIGIAAGICMANRLDKSTDKAIAIVGDGEMEEGSIWESMNFAAKQKLGNLLCIVDRNRLSVTHFIENDNLEEKAKAFGWEVYTVNGHMHRDIEHYLDLFFRKNKSNRNIEKPMMIIANTIKGKGVSFMENEAKWHHGCPTDDEYEQAILELEA
jgi:transketolase